MPQKTKKQKMAAEKRKQQPIQPATHIISKKPTVNLSTEHTAQNSSVFAADSSTLLFKKELYKSLIISTVIILVEIAIYLAQNKVISFTN
ncbi:MAG TPA: hypothetical protein PLS49_01155 [Candidatus Woesebacteria bacterium]|nr:hypothetical protein [Candidatus Woesebacteria bacterium]